MIILSFYIKDMKLCLPSLIALIIAELLARQ